MGFHPLVDLGLGKTHNVFGEIRRGLTALDIQEKQTAQTTGYQIQYSTSASFKSGNKTVTVKGASAVSKKIVKLGAGKTYYVRIRTYRTVGEKNYYSAWSAKKSVKTKK